MSDDDEPQLHVTRPLSPGELAELGMVHPGEAPELHVTLSPGELAELGMVHPGEAPPEVQLSPPLSYTILISPPHGELIAFSDEQGEDPNRYDNARFVLLTERGGSFEFMPSGTRVDVDASGTMNASEERVVFKSSDRGLSGFFLFPRGGEQGEVTLSHGSVRLKARAIRGGPIDHGSTVVPADE